MRSQWRWAPSRFWVCTCCSDAGHMNDIILNTSELPHLLTLLIALPLIGVAVMAFFKDETAIKQVAFWTAAFEFLLSLPLYFWFDPARAQMQFGEVAQWVTLPPIRYALGI